MTGLRGSAHHTLTTPAQLHVRPIMLALTALLVTAIVAVAIVLAANGGDDQARPAKPVQVTPSTQLAPEHPPRPAQPPGVNGPGARP
jgi:hypothetical protein